MSDSKSEKVVTAQYLYPFILVTTLFALWGFANDITNPLVRAFREIFLISNAQSSLVQWAFYGGYATMAIPAATTTQDKQANRTYSAPSNLFICWGKVHLCCNRSYAIVFELQIPTQVL